MIPQFRRLRDEILPLNLGLYGKLPAVTAIACYFDDSRDRGVFSVAGYIAPVEVWDTLISPRWFEIIRNAPHPISEFKASDCRNGALEFGPPWTQEERKTLMDQLVTLLIDPSITDIFGIGGAVAIGDRSEEERWDQVEILAQGLCFGTAISTSFNLLRHLSTVDMVHFIFDAQPGYEGRVYRIFDALKRDPVLQLTATVERPQFSDSKELAPLQAADLLAHETYKELKSRFEPEPRPESAALLRLVEGRRHYGRYYDAETIQALIQRKQQDNPPPIDGIELPLIYDYDPRQITRADFGYKAKPEGEK